MLDRPTIGFKKSDTDLTLGNLRLGEFFYKILRTRLQNYTK